MFIVWVRVVKPPTSVAGDGPVFLSGSASMALRAAKDTYRIHSTSLTHVVIYEVSPEVHYDPSHMQAGNGHVVFRAFPCDGGWLEKFEGDFEERTKVDKIQIEEAIKRRGATTTAANP